MLVETCLPGYRGTAKEPSIIASFLLFSGIFISSKSPWQSGNSTSLCSSFILSLVYAQATNTCVLLGFSRRYLVNSEALVGAFLPLEVGEGKESRRGEGEASGHWGVPESGV